MGHWSWAVAVDPLVLLTILAIISGAIWELAKVIRRVDRNLTRFKEDWEGTPERPGVPARAGVMERLAVIEVSSTDTRHRLDEVVAKMNKGR